MTVDVAHLTQPKVGERENGDAVLVRDEKDGLLLAVIDGLGHGPIAAQAAQAAIEELVVQRLEQPLLLMMQALHTRLRGTRGVAATLCVVRGAEVEACAVGNVALSCTGADIPLVLSAGVLGLRVAKYHVCRGSLGPRARVLIFSDGLSTRLSSRELHGLPPRDACRAAFDRHRKREDDATILIADFTREPPRA